MALPKSTFVMGVVTLGLFGVAIYETAGGKHKRDRAHYDESDDDDLENGDDLDDDALERYAAEEAALAEQRQAEQELAKAKEIAGKKAELERLYGAEVATPGALFQGVVLDSTELTDRTFEDRRRAFIETTGSSLTTGDRGRLDRFEIRPGAREDGSDAQEALCTDLHRQLGTAWGSAYVDDDGVELWTNKVAGLRASFRPGAECELVFEKYDEPAAWISKSGTSTIPLSWVGKPAKFVESAVGAAQEDEVIEWFAHGLGAGAEQTKLQAWVANGKITHIIATTTVSTPTRAALEEHLRSEFGRPKPDQTGARDARLEWPARKLVVVLGDNGSISVMVGKQ